MAEISSERRAALLNYLAKAGRYVSRDDIVDNLPFYFHRPEDHPRSERSRATPHKDDPLLTDLAELERHGVGILRKDHRSGRGEQVWKVDLTGFLLLTPDLSPAEEAVLATALGLFAPGATPLTLGLSRKLALDAGVEPDESVLSQLPLPQESWANLYRAVEQGRRVDFAYQSLSATRPHPVTVEPWDVAVVRDSYLLVARVQDSEQPRVFNLERVQDGVITINMERPAPRWNVDDTLLEETLKRLETRRTHLARAIASPDAPVVALEAHSTTTAVGMALRDGLALQAPELRTWQAEVARSIAEAHR